MSGEIVGQAVGYGIGQVVPNQQQAEDEVSKALRAVDSAFGRYSKAALPELQSHYALVLSDVTGKLAHATYLLQRAAFEAATRPQAVENLPSDPSQAE